MVWSADSSVLTALIPSVMYRPDGTYTIVSIDVESGATTTLANTGAKWAAWSPTNPGEFAYATRDGLFVVANGQTRKLVSIANADAYTNDQAALRFAAGWSPDGRYIARAEASTISVIDVATGSEQVVWSTPAGGEDVWPMWWR
jgi:hypothetical protein